VLVLVVVPPLVVVVPPAAVVVVPPPTGGAQAVSAPSQPLPAWLGGSQPQASPMPRHV